MNNGIFQQQPLSPFAQATAAPHACLFLRGGRFCLIWLAMFFCWSTSQVKAQTPDCDDFPNGMTLDCGDLDVFICAKTFDGTSAGCAGCSNSAVNCRRMQYQVSLRADGNVCDGNEFQLQYVKLALAVKLNVASPNSGRTKINVSESTNCPSSYEPGYEASTGIASILLQEGLQGETPPTITFTRGQPNDDFYCAMFVVVVDVFPGDAIGLGCRDFEYYADNLSGSPDCSLASVGCIAPSTYTLTLGDGSDPDLTFENYMLDAPEIEATVPIQLVNNSGSSISISETDFLLKIESDLDFAPPTFANLSSVAVTVEPATGLHKIYSVYVKSTQSFTLSPSQTKTLFNLKIVRPMPQNLASTVSITYGNGRFESSTDCRRLVPTESAVDVSFPGLEQCHDGDIRLVVQGESVEASPDNCRLRVLVSLDYNASILGNPIDVYELRFKLDFGVGNGIAFGDENEVINELAECPDPNNNSPYCEAITGGNCYSIDGNTFNFCILTDAQHLVSVGLGHYLEIPVYAEGGCINTIAVRDAEIGISGSDACVIASSVEGFPLCPKMVNGEIKDEAGDVREGVEVFIVHTTPPPNTSPCPTLTSTIACSDFGTYAKCLCDFGTYTVTPGYYTDPLNGVSTYDLLLISKHVIGSELLDSPYKIIAADANNSNSVTGLDILEIRKLILGIYNNFPLLPSWRFVDKSIQFSGLSPYTPNPANKESITVEVDETTGTDPGVADFVAIKVGDVNLNHADCGFAKPDLTLGSLNMVTNETRHKKGDYITLPFISSSSEPLSALQAAFKFDPARYAFVGVSAGDVLGITPDCFGLTQVANGEIRVVWVSPDPETEFFNTGQTLFNLTFKALSKSNAGKSVIATDDAILPAIGYRLDGAAYELRLTSLAKESKANNREQATAQSLMVEAVPNPTSGSLHLAITSPKNAEADLAVYGPFGRRLLAQKVSLIPGENDVQLQEVSAWPTGVYTWKIKTPTGKSEGRFIKQ